MSFTPHRLEDSEEIPREDFDAKKLFGLTPLHDRSLFWCLRKFRLEKEVPRVCPLRLPNMFEKKGGIQFAYYSERPMKPGKKKQTRTFR